MAVYARFADLLDYPDDALGGHLEACSAAGLGDGIARFADDFHSRGLAALQELYTSAFDLDGRATLYVGHHLFGESTRRGLFMARLAQEYRESAFRCPEHELPDHLPVVLRFLDARGSGLNSPITELNDTSVRGELSPDPLVSELVTEVVLPATRRILTALEERGNPYRFVVQALVEQLERAGRAGGAGLSAEARVCDQGAKADGAGLADGEAAV